MFRDLLPKPMAPCGTIAAAPRSLCSAWHGASPPSSCCWPTGTASVKPFRHIFANFGTKLMIVFQAALPCRPADKRPAQIRFTLADVDTLTTNLPQITHITPEVDKQSNVQFDDRTYTFDVSGDYPNVDSVRALKLRSGRFFNTKDEMQRARVVVIGSESKDKLFSGRKPSASAFGSTASASKSLEFSAPRCKRVRTTLTASSTFPSPP